MALNETPAKAKNVLSVLVVSMKEGPVIVREPAATDVAVRDPEAAAEAADPEAEPVPGKFVVSWEGI